MPSKRLFVALLVVAGAALPAHAGASCSKPATWSPACSSSPFDLPASATGCTEVSSFMFPDKAKVQAALPSGWTAADASKFISAVGAPVPAPTTRGVVMVGSVTCAKTDLDAGPASWSDVLLLVNTPAVGKTALPPVTFDFFEAATYGGSAKKAKVLNAIGFAPAIGETLIKFSEPAPGLGSGSADVSDKAGVIAHFDFRSPGRDPQPFSTTSRQWTQSAKGLSYMDFNTSSIQIEFGTATGCRLRSDSPASKAAAQSGCLTPGLANVAVLPKVDFTGAFHWLPRAKVQ